MLTVSYTTEGSIVESVVHCLAQAFCLLDNVQFSLVSLPIFCQGEGELSSYHDDYVEVAYAILTSTRIDARIGSSVVYFIISQTVYVLNYKYLSLRIYIWHIYIIMWNT